MTKTQALTATTPDPKPNLISNSRWNLLAFGISLVVNFTTIPIVISYIGLDEFGVAGLVVAIYAPFMLVGTVLGQAIVKELSPLLKTGNFEHAAPILSAALFICALGSIFVVILLTLIGESSVHLLGTQSRIEINWPLAFFVAGIGWSAQQGILILQASVAAAQRYGSLAGTSITAALASAGSTLVGSILWPGYLGYLLGMSTGFLLSLALWIVLFWRGMPRMFPLPSFGRHHAHTIIEFGKWQGGAHFAGAIGNQVDRYVLGALAPLSVVGQYNVAMRLQEVVHMGLLKMTEVLFPHFAVTVDDSIERRASFYIRASWIINVLGVAALAPLIPLASALITLWVSREAADGGAHMLRTLAAAGILGCGVNVYYYFAIGTGQSARLARLTVAHALLTIALTIAAINLWGPLAAGMGYLFANAARLSITSWLSARYFLAAAELRKQIQCTLPPLIAGSLMAYTWAQTGWLQPLGWIQLSAAYVLVAFSVVFASIAATSLSFSGRQMVKETLRSLLNILRRGN